MTISEAQERVDAQIQNYGGYWRPGSMFLRLIEELGELARATNIKYGDKKAKGDNDGKALEKEMADVFYTTLALSNVYCIDFSTNIPNYLQIDTRDDISVIQGKITKDANVDKLLVLHKLVKRIGDFAELVVITTNNIDINYNISEIVMIIIELATIFDINLSQELNSKIGDDNIDVQKTSIYVEGN